MILKKYIDLVIYNTLKKIFTVEENKNKELGDLKKILIIRQHNQLGDLLASVSLFRAIKEKYPESKITLVASPANFSAVVKNNFIDHLFVFNKKKLFSLQYIREFRELLKEEYDLVLVPATVSISFTSNFIARISNSKIRVGLKELNGIKNNYDFFFDRRISLDWRKHPDANVSDFCLDIVRPFGITTENFSSHINFDEDEITAAKKFISTIKTDDSSFLIGLHVGAGKPPNRWSLKKYVELINRLNSNLAAKFYLTGTNADLEEINYVKNNSNVQPGLFLNKKIPELAALISFSDLFITNDTGVMHVAGATKTPQVSIFGPTNPFNWAPTGKQKCFIRRSDLIDDVTVDDVYECCENILKQKKIEPEHAG